MYFFECFLELVCYMSLPALANTLFELEIGLFHWESTPTKVKYGRIYKKISLRNDEKSWY